MRFATVQFILMVYVSFSVYSKIQDEYPLRCHSLQLSLSVNAACICKLCSNLYNISRLFLFETQDPKYHTPVSRQMCLWGKTCKHAVFLVLCYCFVHGAVAFTIQQTLYNFITLISTKPRCSKQIGLPGSTSIGLDKKKNYFESSCQKGAGNIENSHDQFISYKTEHFFLFPAGAEGAPASSSSLKFPFLQLLKNPLNTFTEGL